MANVTRKMPSLRDFLKTLKELGEIVYVDEEVSVKFEMARILREFDGGPAIFFRNVKESTFSVVGNVCGKRSRLCDAVGVREDRLYHSILHAMQNPTTPRIIDEAPVKQIVEKPKLTRFPILTHYEKDAGPYITSAIVAASFPNGKTENLSIHRLLVLDDTHLAIRMVPHRHLHQLYEIARKNGKPLEVAIVIGLHPTLMLASCLPIPFGASEYCVANSLLDGKLALTACESVDIKVPADAEMVFEGFIDHEEAREGPFTDLLGMYDLARNQPVVELVGVLRRKSCMYQALLPGGSEHGLLMGFGRELNIWDAARRIVPSVKAVNLTRGGRGWLHAVISIKKRKEEDAKHVIKSAFSSHPSLKHVVVVDDDIDVFNLEEVEWAIATRFQASRGLITLKNVRGSTIDPSGEDGITDKMGIDATKPLHKPSWMFEKATIPENDRLKTLLKKLKKRRRKIHGFPQP